MRCRFRVAEPFTGEKVTLCFVTRCRATPHHRLRAELSRCGSVRRGSWFPPGTNSIPRPCFAALKGKAERTVFARTRKLSPLCTPSLSLAAPGLPVPRGVSGGGAALSSLCCRFPGGDIMNLTSRRNPLSGLSFSLFFFLGERKRGLRRRRSHKISVTKAKPDNPPNNNVQSLPHRRKANCKKR